MRKNFLVFIVAIIGLLLLSEVSSASAGTFNRKFQLNNLKFGLYDTTLDRIYSETRKIVYKPNGECNVAGVNSLCMYLSLEFDYANSNPGDFLNCSFNSSKEFSTASDYNNDLINHTSDAFKIPLQRTADHFQAVSYVVRGANNQDETQYLSLSCSYFDKEVIHINYSMTYK